ncbi:MAG: TonB-dependent receptor [Sphingopyxis sp.]|nr:TonB-dependent receptor [Sphingopyxis sp.]
MRRLNRATLLTCTCLAAAIAIPGAAAAQATAPDEGNAGDEIIVTAQKRSENLQDVPLAISAFSSETLDNKAVDDAVDLSFSVPNLTVDGGGASLRGVGNLAISSTAESGLGYHVNGVYIGVPATETEYYDLERIEVLRGPQGTLYGRNTTAGVINIITAKPTDAFEGYVTAAYGNFNNVKLKAALNLPIAEGFATRIAGFYLDRNGYTTNVFNNNDIDDRNMFGVRSTTEFDTGDTRATLVVSYFEEDDRRSNGTKGLCTRDPLTGCSALSAGFETPDSRTTIFNTLGAITGTIATGFGPAARDYFAGSINPTDLREVSQDIDPEYFVREWNASFELSHDFGGISLTSLTGFQNITRDILNDFDRFVPSLGLLRPVTFDAFANGQPITTTNIVSARRDLSHAEQWFQEVRLASDYSGPFNFLLGGNYFDLRSDIFVSITHPTLAARQQQRGFSAPFEAFTIESNPVTTKSWGAFGEAYVDLSDRTRFTAGIRYSRDKKFIATRQIFLDPLPDGSVRPFTIGRFRRGVFTGRVVLDHKFTDDVLGYVSLSRGYKAGGINPGGSTVPTFDPEFLNAVEFGLKGSTSDGTFRANLSGFYYDYKGLQVGQVGVTSANTVNSDARVFGAEAEFTIRPVRAFQVDGSVSYLNTSIRNFQSADEGDPNGIAPGTVPVRDAGGNIVRTAGGLVLKDLEGNHLPFSPNWKIAIGVQYAIELGADFTLTPRLDHYQQGRFLGTVFNKPSESFEGYSQTDFKLLLEPATEAWELRAYVKNLFNNDDITRISQEGPLVGRFRSIQILEPRTYGLEATYRF